MRVLVTGGGGQLATAVASTRPDDVDLHVLGIDELDITNETAVRRIIGDLNPEIIINTAAYTAVDAAESDEAVAASVNGDGPRNLAEAIRTGPARMIQVSTDFVFDGTATRPLKVDDPTRPLSVYGRTKLAGEAAVLEALGPRALVVRTAWLHSSGGGNFPKTMLRLMRERGSVRVVDDQTGTPTWAGSLADALWCMIDRRMDGIHHWTDDGSATWHRFAVAVAEIGVELGLLEAMPEVTPVPGSEFPTPASRPAYSVLDRAATLQELEGTRCVPCAHWRENLKRMMEELNGG